jgi:hypothetical protein
MNNLKLLSIKNYEINEKGKNIGTLSVCITYEEDKNENIKEFINIPYELYMDCGDVCVDFDSTEFEDWLLDIRQTQKFEKKWRRIMKNLMDMYDY